MFEDTSNTNVFTWKTASFSDSNLNENTFIQGEQSLEDHPTMNSFLLIRNNKLVYEKYFHGVDASKSKNIHSASKNIFSALIGIAIEKGVIKSVDDPILTYFTDYKPIDTLKNAITIRHLLNMTSGLQWIENQTDADIQVKENWVKAILDLPLANTPGTVYNYNTGNTHVLSAVLKNALGEDMCTFLYTNLMTDIGVVVEHMGTDPQGIPSGGFNFYISPRELAQFGLLYLNNGMYNGKQIIPNTWVTASLTPQVTGIFNYYGANYDYSYTWYHTTINNTKVFKAWGFAGQYLCLLPEYNMAIVATADTTAGDYNEFNIDNFIRDFVLTAIQ